MIFFMVTVITIDQASKWLVNASVSYNNSKEIINGFFRSTNAHNFGAAWSIFWNQKYLLIIIPILAFIFLVFLIFKEKKLTLYKSLYYGMLIGGIIGNLIDRIILGYVIDFLDFTFFEYNFPIFNICDVFIVISIFLILIECFIPINKTNLNQVELLNSNE